LNRISVGDRLDVHLTGEKVGELEHRGPGRYRFEYLTEVVETHEPGSLLLSASLPIQADPFPPSAARPFFEGLLPEGAVRTTIARSLGVSEDNSFGLLAELGAECAGAVVIVPTGEAPAPLGAGSIKWLDDDELAKEVEELPRHPLGVSPDEEVRLSLGGVQHKLVVTRDATGRLGKPLRGAPSTHILKPGQEAYEDLVVNEAFCLRISRCIGLRTAGAEIIDVGGAPCLLVERFDRTLRGAGQIERVHQEDSCQALGRLPSEKYETEGGPSLADEFVLLRVVGGANVARDINSLLDAAVLNFVIGNSDAHGKNLALLYREVGVAELAPLYDLVCTNAYTDLTERMAMTIGGEDDPRNVGPDAWGQLVEDARLGRQALRRVRDQAARVRDCARAQREAARAEGWHRPIIDRVLEVCEARYRQVSD
jgi:serine/threonine-protein kinase HipA